MKHIINGFNFSLIILFYLFYMPLQVNAEDECKPVAILKGARQSIEPIRSRLKEIGIKPETIEGCPYIVASVIKEDQNYLITISDSFGREAKRNFTSLSSVVAWIDSWARSSIGWELIAPKQVKTEQKKEPRTIRKLIKPDFHPDDSSYGISATADGFYGFDESFWLGARIAAWKTVSPASIGGSLRYAGQLAGSPDIKKYSMDRLTVDALAEVDFIFRSGRFRIGPGFGLGIGWLRSHGKAEPYADGTDGSRWESFDTWGVVGDLRFTFAVEINHGMGIMMGTFFKSYIPAHENNFRLNGRKLPGEPWGFTGVSLGLTYAN